MPFERILSDLVTRTPGAFGALFLDWEGEAVESFGVNTNQHDLKLVGAYQGIFLDRLRRICTDSALGAPRRFKVEHHGSTFLNTILTDGYYLVLVLSGDSIEAVAWEQLRKTREALLEEM